MAFPLIPRAFYVILSILASSFSAIGEDTGGGDASVNVLANGGFDEGNLWWRFSGNAAILSDPIYPPRDGQNLVAFNTVNSPADGVVSQTFGTVAGKTYTLEFDIGVYAYTLAEQRLQVSVTGSSGLLSHMVSMRGIGGGQTVWVSKFFTFTADRTSTTLLFRDVSPSTASIDMLLDHVRVMGPAAANVAPVAVPDYVIGTAAEVLSIYPSSLLRNDLDSYGSVHSVHLDEQPAHGELQQNSNGSFIYTPEPGFVGKDTFRYHANDGQYDSNITTVTIDMVQKGSLANGSFERGSLEWGTTGWDIVGNVTVESAPPY
ncbi:MAG: DUF642 domain-containing protein, partial [Verrucomicrobiaceae bacterium]